MGKVRRVKLAVPESEVIRMLRCAMSVCRKLGLAVDDPEIGGAINAGVYRAATDWDATKGRSPTSLAALYAKREARKASQSLNRGSRPDSLTVDPTAPVSRTTEVSPTDFSVLEFVAANGLTNETAKSLGLSPARLRERVDAAALRVRRAARA